MATRLGCCPEDREARGRRVCGVRRAVVLVACACDALYNGLLGGNGSLSKLGCRGSLLCGVVAIG